VRSMFADIPTSLFTLFQLTTSDDWSRIAHPVVAMHPLWAVFFIFYITFMSWTMLSLLTAVASELVIDDAAIKKLDETVFEEKKRQGFGGVLNNEFCRSDGDANGVLDRGEFCELMTGPTLKQEMLNHGIQLQERDLGEMWDTFDIDESGTLTVDELVTGFSYLQECLATKHVANVGYCLKRFSVKIDNSVGQLELSIDKLKKQQEEMLSRVLAHQEQHQAQWSQFLWQQQKTATVPAENTDGELPKDASKPQRYMTAKQRSSSRLTKSGQLSKFANFSMGSGRLTTSSSPGLE